jgi:hypothetical protein
MKYTGLWDTSGLADLSIGGAVLDLSLLHFGPIAEILAQ